MDITKYLTNKEIQLSNDDFNIEKLEKDLRKGFVPSEEVDKAREDALKESTANYSQLENDKNKLEKTLADTEARNAELTTANREANLKVEMVSQGFKKEDLAEVIKLRNSIYQDEEDDSKAITMIKERYNATFFPKVETVEEKKVDIPNDDKFVNPTKKPVEIDVSRKTSIKDIVIK
jgi:hypothetical protein